MPAYTNATQTIPELFKEIMRIDDQIEQKLIQSAIPFDTHKLIARKRELMSAAEKALHWNVDKGATG
jgi:hypothetical protein